jgi:hypothetical protein
MRGEVRAAGPRLGGRAWGGVGASGMHVDVARLKAWGPRARRARAERTRNIWLMVVTLEVSQPEMSASKFFKL